MAPHNGSGDLLQNIRDFPQEIKAAIELIGAGEELIPVQLPEGPGNSLASPTGSPTMPKSSVDTICIDSNSPNRLRKSHPGSPLSVFRHSNIPSESPGSPRSDFSRNSEESVIIVGDTFSAPMNIQFSMDSSPHVRDAGAFDRYSRSVNQPLSSSQSWRQDDPSPSLTSTSPLNSRRTLPSPPVSQLGSPFVPGSPKINNSYVKSPLISRPRASPSGPRPLERPDFYESGAKASRWRKKKRREEMFPEIGSGSSNDFGQSPLRLNRVASTQDLVRQQSAPQLLPDHGLNPFATSFRPTKDSISRAHSLPGAPASAQPMTMPPSFQRQYSSDSYAQNPVHAPSLGLMQAESLASIEQDLHHLRQWSSLFQMQSFAFPEYQGYQSHSQHPPKQQQQHLLLHQRHYQGQPQYQHQGNTFNMLPLRGGPGNAQVFSSSTTTPPRFASHRVNQRPTAYHSQGNRSLPVDARHSPPPQLQFGGNSGSSESSTSTPISVLADLPLEVLAHALTEIQLPEIRLSTSLRDNPASNRNAGSPMLRGAMSNNETSRDGHFEYAAGMERQRNYIGPRHGIQANENKVHGTSSNPSTPMKAAAIGRTLTARGKTSLTPVTERSEVSTSNASTANSSTSASNSKPRRNKRRRAAKPHHWCKEKRD